MERIRSEDMQTLCQYTVMPSTLHHV